MSFKERYSKLNKKQREAVDHIDGPLLVIAGPGSGKTELLGVRTANILNKTDTPLGSILCLTFTDSASHTMRERLIDLLGESGYRVPIHTFHSFCVEIMNRYPEFFHSGVTFHPADEVAKISIIESIIRELDDENPLSSYHPKKGYIHLNSVRECISSLKQGGLTPDEFLSIIQKNKKELSFIEKELSFLSNRVNKGMLEEARVRAEKLISKEDKSLFKSLSFAIGNALLKNSKSTTLLSEFKAKMTIREDSGYILKDRKYIEKMESLAEVYKSYEKKMYEEGLYDFEDMILRVISVLRANEALKLTLQEKYLHIMIDEFQDTNGVQMRLLELLTDNHINEGKPNICVVGDDDQAIYRFQGAELSNIIRFKKKYRDVKVIALTDNYRSTQDIIDTSTKVINKGEERLVNIIPNLNKNLKSAVKQDGGNVVFKKFETEEEEYSFVATKIGELIKTTPPSEIAVISRLNKNLNKALPYFYQKQIPVVYHKNDNVLDLPQIRQIINILRLSVRIMSGDRYFSEELLPEIISYPFWGVSREELWNLSVNSYQTKNSWLSCMANSSKLSNIRDFLLDLGVKAKNEPAENVIDIIIGSKEGTMISPFKEYYFKKENFNQNPEEYVNLISSLRSFFRVLREHKEGRVIKATDVIEFVDLCEKNNIRISRKQSRLNAVSLISSHGAKGMEFETVFVLNCQDEVWNSNRGGMSTLSLPTNLPLKRAGDNYDDKLRIFYVTLTRAKKNIFLTLHTLTGSNRKNTPLSFISHIPAEEDSFTKNITTVSEKSFYPIKSKEKDILFPLVEKYKLSSTDLCYFLDISSGGPEKFFEDKMLRFPQKKSTPMSFGTAMHNSISDIYMKIKNDDTFPKEKQVLNIFKNHLISERLSEKDFNKCLKKGEKSLSLYIKKRKKDFLPEHQIERSFRNQGCSVEGIDITGAVDKIIIQDNKIEVVDFKTGRPVLSWKGKDDYEKIKLWKFKKQLIFYKLLIESSEEFKGKYEVATGVIDFLEPKEEEFLSLTTEFTEEDIDTNKELIKKVGQSIKKLHFPSISKYKSSYSGILKFEEDILKSII